MLTLTALEEGDGLRIRTQVVTPPVWKLPLPGGEQLELVLVPGGDYGIGSPQTEQGRNWYANQRDGCKDVNVEAKRTLRLEPFAMARHAITQAQWRAVAELPQVEKELKPTPGTYRPDGLWETHAQPGALPVDSVSWNDCQEWLQRLNRWLTSEWSFQGGKGEPRSCSPDGEGHGKRPVGPGLPLRSTSAMCSMPLGRISMAAIPTAQAARGCIASGRCRWASLDW